MIRPARRTVPAAIAALTLALAAPAAAQEPTLPDIEDEVMCTICGTPLEHSFSPQADRQRDFIRALIAEGRDKDEIKDALVAEYGEDVLATPDDSGFDLTAWVVPAAGFGIALVAVIGALLRVRRTRGEPELAAPLDRADSARLDDELTRFDD